MNSSTKAAGTPRMADVLQSANPFDYAAPIRKEELFFDRRVEMREALLVCERVARGSAGGVSIYGGKGAGKTSFLNALRRELSKKKIASARIPLDSIMVAASNEPRLFKLFLNDLTSAAQEEGLIEKTVASQVKQLLAGVIKVDKLEFDAFGISLIAEAAKENRFNDLPYAALRDGLRDFSKLLKGKHSSSPGAMLILDEADHLKQNKALLEIFRNVFQDTPGIGLILAGTSKLMSDVSEVFSPIPRFFWKIELGPFSDDDEVDNAISKTVQFAKSDLLMKGIRFNVMMSQFIPEVTDLTNRLPQEFNMLSHFAFNIGSTRARHENGSVTLYMKLDREVIDAALKQWQGTREYVDFLEDLSGIDKSILSLLSKIRRGGASLEELTALTILDRMAIASKSAKVEELELRLDELSKQKPTIQLSIQHISALEEKCKVRILNPTLSSIPIYEVEDQWMRAYFKYGALGPQVNLEFGLIAENSGALIFGDPISSILDSMFLSRLIHNLEDPPPFRINSYPDDGKFLAGRGKILNASYRRVADARDWHLAFHLKPETDTFGLKKDIERLLQKLKSVQLIQDYRVRERMGSSDWS